ncbi:glycerophosphodiester phosphodiesterase [Hyphobacterium sp. CCMP332]|nr:glycerophosphodiester phosphodiesterase [Hyphobacterium sp. CCMP332]
MKNLFTVFILFLLLGCGKNKINNLQNIDIQGHRGCRGLMPENSIPAMQKALELGVSTLEMDVVISSDKKVLLSHEPFFNSEICFNSLGEEIVIDCLNNNLYQMNYSKIELFDCGLKRNDQFPKQKKISVKKPLLEEVIHLAKSENKKKRSKICQFNIEIKSRPQWDGIYHPEIEVYCDLVMEVLESCQIISYSTIQSFDPRVLIYMHKKYPKVRLAYLLEDVNDWSEAIKILDFEPEIISPYYNSLSQSILNNLHSRGFLVIPWTVNEEAEIEKLLRMGVDGIISDYPNVLIDIINKIKEPSGNSLISPT